MLPRACLNQSDLACGRALRGVGWQSKKPVMGFFDYLGISTPLRA